MVIGSRFFFSRFFFSETWRSSDEERLRNNGYTRTAACAKYLCLYTSKYVKNIQRSHLVTPTKTCLVAVTRCLMTIMLLFFVRGILPHFFADMRSSRTSGGSGIGCVYYTQSAGLLGGTRVLYEAPWVEDTRGPSLVLFPAR